MHLAQLVIAGFLLILIQLYACRAWNLKKLTVSRSFSKSKVFSGENVKYAISISNNKILPLMLLEVETEFPGQFLIDDEKISQTALAKTWLHKGILSLLWFQKVTRYYSMKCTARGYYRLPEVTLTTGDFLGINSFSTKVPSSCELVVYPDVYPLRRWAFARRPMGEHSVRRWIIDDPLLVTGVREYTPGDPLNSIHWNTSARLGRLHVKLYDYTASHSVMVFLNMRTFDSYWEGIDQQLAEELITFCASFSNHLLTTGASLGIASNGHVPGNFQKIIFPDSNKKQKEKIMDYLGRLSRYIDSDLKETALNCKKTLPYGTTVYFITGKVFDYVLEAASQYAKWGYHVTILAAEKEERERLEPGIDISYFHRRGSLEYEETTG